MEDKRMIVGLGEALWDVLPEGKKLGGAPANFAYHTGQFGLDTLAISALGEDRLGDETIAAIEEQGLNYMMPLAQRNVVSRGTIKKFLSATPDDCMKIFDINLRQNFYTKEVIDDSLHLCNVLKINDEELVVIGRMFGYPGLDMQDKCWLLLGKYNLDILVLTCGVNGSYVFTPGSMSFYETPKVEVADTVGAGDSFTGTFCACILKGKSVADAHRIAVDASAFVCTQKGAMPKLPDTILNA